MSRKKNDLSGATRHSFQEKNENAGDGVRADPPQEDHPAPSGHPSQDDHPAPSGHPSQEGNGTAPVLAELEEWKDRAQRTQAEYENFRRRTAAERQSLLAAVRADTVAALLPVYDNLLRATQQPTEDAAYAKGVELTLQQLLAILAELGVTPFGTAGEAFDPNVCDAVAHVEDENHPANTVIEVFSQGFRINDKVIRHAMVRVAN